MPARDPERRREVARIGAGHRWKSPAVADAHAALKAKVLEEHIRKTVETWPPLTDAQRDRLALLLRGGEVA